MNSYSLICVIIELDSHSVISSNWPFDIGVRRVYILSMVPGSLICIHLHQQIIQHKKQEEDQRTRSTLLIPIYFLIPQYHHQCHQHQARRQHQTTCNKPFNPVLESILLVYQYLRHIIALPKCRRPMQNHEYYAPHKYYEHA